MSDQPIRQSELRTLRLTLEPIEETHALELWELFNDNELHQFVPYEPVTLEKQKDRCGAWAKRRSPDGSEIWLNWAARDKATGKIMGHFQCGIKEMGIATIGYVVARAFQNKGYAQEALHSIFGELQKTFSVTEVKAWSDTRNKASHRLAEKCGMIRVDLIKDADFFKGSTSDEYVFSKKFT